MDAYLLKLRQAMTLDLKIRYTKERIKQWVDHWGVDGVYVSFSGGKDSTVLLDIVRSMYPEIPAVFVDTGLEYPEIKRFVSSVPNVTVLRPEMRFDKVIETYGYPIISKEVSESIDQGRKSLKTGKYTYRLEKLFGKATDKNGNKSMFNQEKWKFLLDAPFKISNKCCDVMKKKPVHLYYKKTDRKPIIGTMACESRLRKTQYLKTGCNAFEAKIPTSTPLGFWIEQDILHYLYEKKIPYAPIYGQIIIKDGVFYTTVAKRTGCMFCAFGCHLEKHPNRFEQMKETHPIQYDYCINKLGMGKVLDYIGVKY